MEAEPITTGKQQGICPPEIEQTNEKVRKRPGYKNTYRIDVQKYVNEGYAQKITNKTELDHPKQWFLPHRGVYNSWEEEDQDSVWRNSIL